MPRGSKTAALSGPWLGMEERENFQTEAHCQLALNVDFSRGYIEARQGFRRVAQTAPPRSRLHVHREDGEPKYLLSIGVIPAGGFIEFQVHEFDSGGSSVTSGTTQDITAVFGEPADQEFDCSFVSVILVGFEDPSVATPTKTKPNHVTLITTKHQTYVFNPVEDSSSLRKIDMTQEAIQLNSLNWGYWNVVPQAPIATEHQSRVYYAGISKDFDVVLTSPLDELQTLIPDMLIDQVDKSVFTLGQQFMAWSDEFDPLGIVAYHFAAVEAHEKITGLRSFQEQLVIFTDRSIYVKTGGTDETFQIFKVVSDVGCVAPHSIVEVGGVLMFMARMGSMHSPEQASRALFRRSAHPSTRSLPAGIQIHTSQRRPGPTCIRLAFHLAYRQACSQGPRRSTSSQGIRFGGAFVLRRLTQKRGT